jgi:hypothetical protein
MYGTALHGVMTVPRTRHGHDERAGQAWRPAAEEEQEAAFQRAWTLLQDLAVERRRRASAWN